MQQICEQGGTKLAGGHQYRFHPCFVRARDAIHAGRIGTLQLVKAAIKSSLANNGPHLFDTVRYLLDGRDVKSATCECYRTEETFDRGYAVENGATGTVEFDGGIHLDFSTGDSSKDFFRIVISGSKGTIEATPQSLVICGEKVLSFAKNTQHLYRRKQFTQFARWVGGSTERYLADERESGKSAELVLALYEAARTVGPIELPLSNQGDVLAQLYSRDEPCELNPPNVQLPESSTLAINGGKRAVKEWFPNKPHIGTDEVQRVVKVLLSGKLNAIGGTAVPAFESAVAKAYGSSHVVASTSGTASIHVALGAFKPRPW